MGAGKSFIGGQLAEHLELPFVDIDQQIEQESGMTIQQIFTHQGEAAFRVLEEEVLAKYLASTPPAVIATGGGCILSQNNRELLNQSSWVVYLMVSAAVAIARCENHKHIRPLLQDENPLACWEMITQKRQMHYDSVADMIFNTDDLSVNELVAQILTAKDAQNGC